MSQRGVVFVSGNNIYAQFREHLGDGRVDFDLLRQWIEEVSGIPIVRVYFYTPELTKAHAHHSRQQAFLHSLRRKNYINIRTRPLVTTDDGRDLVEGLDVQMAADLFRIVVNRGVDHVFVVSGDQDLQPALNLIKDYGVTVWVVSFADKCATCLIEEADKFLDLSQEIAMGLVVKDESTSELTQTKS